MADGETIAAIIMNFRCLTSPDSFCMCIVGWTDKISPFFP